MSTTRCRSALSPPSPTEIASAPSLSLTALTFPTIRTALCSMTAGCRVQPRGQLFHRAQQLGSSVGAGRLRLHRSRLECLRHRRLWCLLACGTLKSLAPPTRAPLHPRSPHSSTAPLHVNILPPCIIIFFPLAAHTGCLRSQQPARSVLAAGAATVSSDASAPATLSVQGL